MRPIERKTLYPYEKIMRLALLGFPKLEEKYLNQKLIRWLNIFKMFISIRPWSETNPRFNIFGIAITN